ncbi:hypothetical protein NCAS_0C03580 [Naumovozyma castellii]|uniref:MHD domain-containing protein n=1 Tax=Naumovozyma castellii TaxID=27288 RepID=G0VCY7_NAUCA|nr:hypothetical protein NCAS_0C03580 [Naumovozyma castellii CBS 4309]CCC69348.1 hypothetical protein NCAS_0C03580 [Naumovozyma castellii CBS 4309]
MINALLIFTARGELVVSKLFKGSMKRSIADIFRIQVINNLDVRSPILTLGSTTFHHIKSTRGDNLWIVAVSRNNVDSAAIWEFLYKLDSLLDSYGLNHEEYLKEEFMIVHELLDVMMCGSGGIPMLTENSLVISRMSVKPSKSILEAQNSGNGSSNTNSNNNNNNVPDLLMSGPKLLRRNSASLSQDLSILTDFKWRPKGIVHKKNEVILHVNERINILVSKDGSVLKAYVDGSIDLETHLSGTPICQFGLNDSLSVSGVDSDMYGSHNHNHHFGDVNFDKTDKKQLSMASVGSVILEDCKFHQCVSLDKFDKDRIIKFVPPDGSMELMKYHVRDNLNLPFKVSPIVTNTRNGTALEYRITMKSLFPGRLSAKNVALHIPVPPNTMDCKINVTNGSCKFIPEESAMIWRFNKFNGLTENTLSAVTIPTKDNTQLSLQQWSKPPMSLDFEILMFSNSGLVVRYFTITERDQKYKAVKWIKYISRSGSYEIRY